VVVVYTQLVILWGAYVRAAGAGNGCGPNWPLCDGQFLPHAPKLKMFIEFFHRVSSGLDGVLILVLWAGAMWLYPRRHRVRRAATAALGFVGIEALLGAALVLFGWVGMNASPARVTADAAHLVNTMLLLAAVLLTALWASGVEHPAAGGPPKRRWLLGAGAAAILATAVCGVMVALADTLYPSTSLIAGMRLDLSHAAPMLDRLRAIHPAVAILTGLFLIWIVTEAPAQQRLHKTLGYAVFAAVLVQWTAGATDMLLLTPVAMQILHLLGADLVWMALIAYAAAELADAPAKATSGSAVVGDATA
jgi:heme A synthase